MLKKFVPSLHVKSIFSLDYEKLYQEGIRLILLDLDNTLITYKMTEPTNDLFLWKNKLEQMGFELMIVSNSKKQRVVFFAKLFGIKYVQFAKKPLKNGFKRALSQTKNTYQINEVAEIGDQIMTDVLGANRMGFLSILVDPIDKKTEFLVTRMNRLYEKIVFLGLKIFKKKMYNERIKGYQGEIRCKEDV